MQKHLRLMRLRPNGLLREAQSHREVCDGRPLGELHRVRHRTRQRSDEHLGELTRLAQSRVDRSKLLGKCPRRRPLRDLRPCHPELDANVGTTFVEKEVLVVFHGSMASWATDILERATIDSNPSKTPGQTAF